MARNPLTGAADHSPAFDDGARRPGGPKADAAPRPPPRARRAHHGQPWTALNTLPAPRKAQRLRSRTVLATRQPLLLLRFPVEFLLRFAERTERRWPLASGRDSIIRRNRSRNLARGLPPPGPPQGAKRRRSRTQSNVLATRKPKSLLRFPVEFQLRIAERTTLGSPFHEPPRNTRREQSPEVHALPSAGAPA